VASARNEATDHPLLVVDAHRWGGKQVPTIYYFILKICRTGFILTRPLVPLPVGRLRAAERRRTFLVDASSEACLRSTGSTLSLSVDEDVAFSVGHKRSSPLRQRRRTRVRFFRCRDCRSEPRRWWGGPRWFVEIGSAGSRTAYEWYAAARVVVVRESLRPTFRSCPSEAMAAGRRRCLHDT
jgi:hypothetical protein